MAPEVSVVIPTLNEASNIGLCIDSIRRQGFKDLEIIVVDGLSADDTRLIAERFGARVLNNQERSLDAGKMIGIKAAKGDVILMMDADNRLVGEDYIQRAAAVLKVHRDVFCVESVYLPCGNSLNTYLTELLHVSDPVSWAMSSPPRVCGAGFPARPTVLCTSTGAWPLGSNGCFFRRKDFERIGLMRRDRFEDCSVALEVAQALDSGIWARIAGCGVEHYFCRTLGQFIRKRRRQAFHYLRYRATTNYRWIAQQPRVPAWVACLYCASIIGPVIKAVGEALHKRRAEWLWHAAACPASVIGLMWGILTYGRGDMLEASLQPPSEWPYEVKFYKTEQRRWGRLL